jgi:hypothetical protein
MPWWSTLLRTIGISTPVHQETSDDDAEILDDVDIASMQYSPPPGAFSRAVHSGGEDEVMQARSMRQHAAQDPEVIIKFKGDVAAIDSFVWHTRTQSASFATDDLCARFVNGFMLTTDHLYTMNKPIDLIHRLTRRTVLRLYPENGLWHISIPLAGDDSVGRELSVAPSWEDDEDIWNNKLIGGPDPLEAASRIREMAQTHTGSSSRLPDLAVLELPIFELLCRMNDADPSAYRKGSNDRMSAKTPQADRTFQKQQQSCRLGTESVFGTRYATMPMGDAMDLLALARPMEERVKRLFGDPDARDCKKGEYDAGQLGNSSGMPQSFAAQPSPVCGMRDTVKRDEYILNIETKDLEEMLQQAKTLEGMLQHQDHTEVTPEQRLPTLNGNVDADIPATSTDTTCEYNEPKPFITRMNKMRTSTERGATYQFRDAAADVPDMKSEGVCNDEDDELRLESEACV